MLDVGFSFSEEFGTLGKDATTKRHVQYVTGLFGERGVGTWEDGKRYNLNTNGLFSWHTWIKCEFFGIFFSGSNFTERRAETREKS